MSKGFRNPFKGKGNKTVKAPQAEPIYIMVITWNPRDSSLRPAMAGDPIPIDIAFKMLDRMRDELIAAQIKRASEAPNLTSKPADSETKVPPVPAPVVDRAQIT